MVKGIWPIKFWNKPNIDQFRDIFVILFQNIDILACLINFYYFRRIYCSSETGSGYSTILLGEV